MAEIHEKRLGIGSREKSLTQLYKREVGQRGRKEHEAAWLLCSTPRREKKKKKKQNARANALKQSSLLSLFVVGDVRSTGKVLRPILPPFPGEFEGIPLMRKKKEVKAAPHKVGWTVRGNSRALQRLVGQVKALCSGRSFRKTSTQVRSRGKLHQFSGGG